MATQQPKPTPQCTATQMRTIRISLALGNASKLSMDMSRKQLEGWIANPSEVNLWKLISELYEDPDSEEGGSWADDVWHRLHDKHDFDLIDFFTDMDPELDSQRRSDGESYQLCNLRDRTRRLKLLEKIAADNGAGLDSPHCRDKYMQALRMPEDVDNLYAYLETISPSPFPRLMTDVIDSEDQQHPATIVNYLAKYEAAQQAERARRQAIIKAMLLLDIDPATIGTDTTLYAALKADPDISMPRYWLKLITDVNTNPAKLDQELEDCLCVAEPEWDRRNAIWGDFACPDDDDEGCRWIHNDALIEQHFGKAFADLFTDPDLLTTHWDSKAALNILWAARYKAQASMPAPAQ